MVVEKSECGVHGCPWRSSPPGASMFTRLHSGELVLRSICTRKSEFPSSKSEVSAGTTNNDQHVPVLTHENITFGLQMENNTFRILK